MSLQPFSLSPFHGVSTDSGYVVRTSDVSIHTASRLIALTICYVIFAMSRKCAAPKTHSASSTKCYKMSLYERKHPVYQRYSRNLLTHRAFNLQFLRLSYIIIYLYTHVCGANFLNVNIRCLLTHRAFNLQFLCLI